MKHYTIRISIIVLLAAGLLLGACSRGTDTGQVEPIGPLGPQGDPRPSSPDLEGDVIVIEKSGVVVTEEYSFTDFSQLEISMFDVTVRQGKDYRVTLEMDDNLLNHVQVSQEGETLRIGLDPSEAYQMEDIHMRADVTIQGLTRLTMDLCDDGQIIDLQSENDLVIDLGLSSLSGKVRAGDLEIMAELDSTVQIGGSADNVTITATRDSVVDLSELQCEDVVVTARMGSHVTVYPTGRLDAEVTAAEVWYVGNPTLGEIKTNLSGSVDKQQ